MKKIILPLLFLAVSVFLFAPINKARADQFSCKISGCSQSGCTPIDLCQTISADNQDAAATQCFESARTNGYTLAITDTEACGTLKDYACTKNGQCSDITATDYQTASGECHASCTGQETCSADVNPCSAQGTPTDYACDKNGQCSDISAPDYDTADQKCRARCTGQETCLSSSNPCPKNPLAGASVKDLKTQAQGLNKAGFKNPADLINRAIQILLAFIGSIALALYVWSGLKWMMARGDSQSLEVARKTMIWTTLGVVMMLASYMLASFIFKSLGVL